jgi:hypothetical protein
MHILVHIYVSYAMLNNIFTHLNISTKNKLHKVNTEIKSQLACHLLRLLYSLYEHLSVSPPRFFENRDVRDALHS